MTDEAAVSLMEFWFSVAELEGQIDDRDRVALEHIKECLWQLQELKK